MCALFSAYILTLYFLQEFRLHYTHGDPYFYTLFVMCALFSAYILTLYFLQEFRLHYTHGDPYFYTLFVMCVVLILLGFLVIYSFCFVWVMKVR